MKNTSLLRIIGIISAIFTILIIIELSLFYALKTRELVKKRKFASLQVIKQVASAKQKTNQLKQTNKTKYLQDKKPLLNTDITVVLDPTHGGEDTGLTWSFKNKIYEEKQIVLDFAIILANLLRSEGIKTELLRSEDYKLSLEARYEKLLNFKQAIYMPIIVSNTREDTGSFCFMGASWENSHLDIESLENQKFNLSLSNPKKSVEILEKEEFLFNQIKLSLELNKISYCHKLFASRHNFSFLSLFNEDVSIVLSLGFINNNKTKVLLESHRSLENQALKLKVVFLEILKAYQGFLDNEKVYR